MASHTVNIKLQSGGADKVVGDFGKVRKASTDLIVNVKKIGNIFGDFGGSVGSLLQNFLKGSV